jgi:aspartyl-tRNA(Asn)/glutamyl-tRNA(Gln) amidotransferase subunit A
MDLTDLTLSEAAGEIAARRISPVDLTRACLERIERYDPSLNCFITLSAESALKQANQAENEIHRGVWRGALHGIPLALKDLYETAGVRTTAGSSFFSEHVPEVDAFTVQKLKSAGAVLLGKLNMHEIALGVTNDNPHFGACINPWDASRITGGSSGGSAAALAAGLCLGSLGSDTGGSIRIPASLCGVVGLKPTFGRVSLRGVMPLSWNLDHAGPMARRVRDAAILLQAVAGFDPEDPGSQDKPVDDYQAALQDGVRGWRVALATGAYFTKTEPEVLQAVRAAARLFEELGAAVEEVEMPELLEAAQANGLMVTSDAAAFHRERLKSRPQDFGPDVLQRLQNGAAFSSSEYVLARHTQSLLRRRFEAFFADFDVLLMPSTPIPAPERQGADAVQRAQQLTRFTSPFNLTGLPALSLPCGSSAEGLPIGLQIVAGPWKEAALLRAGYAYEQATEWHKKKPNLL